MAVLCWICFREHKIHLQIKKAQVIEILPHERQDKDLFTCKVNAMATDVPMMHGSSVPAIMVSIQPGILLVLALNIDTLRVVTEPQHVNL